MMRLTRPDITDDLHIALFPEDLNKHARQDTARKTLIISALEHTVVDSVFHSGRFENGRYGSSSSFNGK
jgi:hypothetical protein